SPDSREASSRSRRLRLLLCPHEQRKRVSVKNRPLRDEQRKLRARIGECANLRHDERFVVLERRKKIERDLTIEDLFRNGLNAEHADRLLCELFDAFLPELGCWLNHR